jgi:hypothetical protein
MVRRFAVQPVVGRTRAIRALIAGGYEAGDI